MARSASSSTWSSLPTWRAAHGGQAGARPRRQGDHPARGRTVRRRESSVKQIVRKAGFVKRPLRSDVAALPLGRCWSSDRGMLRGAAVSGSGRVHAGAADRRTCSERQPFDRVTLIDGTVLIVDPISPRPLPVIDPAKEKQAAARPRTPRSRRREHLRGPSGQDRDAGQRKAGRPRRSGGRRGQASSACKGPPRRFATSR